MHEPPNIFLRIHFVLFLHVLYESFESDMLCENAYYIRYKYKKILNFNYYYIYVLYLYIFFVK